MSGGINVVYHKIVPAGGAERGAIDIITELARRGMTVRVVTRKFDESLFSPEIRKNIELVLVKPRFPFCVLRKLMVHDFENRAKDFCNPAWKILTLARLPQGADLEDTGSGTHVRHLERRGKRPGFFDKLLIARERASYGKSKVIVARSTGTADDIADFIGEEARGRMHVLFPSTDTTRFCLAARESRERLRCEWARIAGAADGNFFFLLFPSNDHKRKGAPLILSALETLPENIRLVVASKIPLEHPRAVNIGFHRDVEKLYGAADASVLASEYEPFGRVGVESILCGVPALVSRACGCAEVLSEPGGFVFDLNAESLREAILRVYEKTKAEGDFLVSVPPEKSIHFPYSLAKRVDRLLELMGERI